MRKIKEKIDEAWQKYLDWAYFKHPVLASFIVFVVIVIIAAILS